MKKRSCFSLKVIFIAWVSVMSCCAALANEPDKAYVEYLTKNAKPPEAYLVNLFAGRDVILLGEDHAIRQNLQFVADAIPTLYAANVRNLVMEFGAEEDQPALDRLLQGDVYDEAAAKALMFNYNSMWSWEEYRAIYKKVWAFNKTLKHGQAPFRIVNMSYRFRWPQLGNVRTPEAMSRVFWRGSINQFRAGIVEREVLSRGEKALILTGSVHALSRYEWPEFHYNRDGFCGYDDMSLGNRLRRTYGSRIGTVLFHQIFLNRSDRYPSWVAPAGGELERLVLEAGGKPVGFDLHGAVMGTLSDDSYFATCHTNFTLGDLADGYIFLAPLGGLKAATADPDFVTAANLKEAIAQFPDPDREKVPADLEGVRQHIRDMAANQEARYAAFK